MKTTLFAAALAVAALAVPAGAAQISALTDPDGVVTFDGFDLELTSGPLDLPVTSPPGVTAPGVAFTATVESTLGADIAELGANGTWGAGRLFAALGTASVEPDGSMSFTFTTPVARVGALVNAFFDPLAQLPPEVAIVALDAFDAVLESYLVSVSTTNGLLNDGVFAGIGRSANDIKTFRVSGFGLVLDDLAFASVPAPAAGTLLLAGLLGASALRRLARR